MNFLEPEKPVFIVGCPRSGTTVLTVRLGRHSQIVATPETVFFELITHFWPPGIKNQPMNNLAIKRLMRIPRMVKLDLKLSDVINLVEHTDRSHRSIFCAIMECCRRKVGKPIWCEKTPRHLYHVNKIFKFFPNAKIVHIVRDGRDVADSLRNVFWRENNLSIQAHEWLYNAKLGFEFQNRFPTDMFLTVFYEDFIKNPEKVLGDICHFIGLELEPQQLSNLEDSEDIAVDKWTGHESDLARLGKTKKELDSNRVAAWKRNCSEDEIVLMNYILGPWLKRWGYNDTEVSMDSLEKTKLFIQSKLAWSARQLLDIITRYSPRFRTKKYLKFFGHFN